MHSVMKIAVVSMATVALLTACSTTKIEYLTSVELNNAGVECDTNPYCWLPTQYEPAVVNGQSVGETDVWPVKGDYVVVVCETTGEKVTNSAGKESDRWFGIVVPKGKVTDNIPITRVKDGYLGYVSSLWLAEKPVSAPDC